MKRREEFEPIDDSGCKKDKVVIIALSIGVMVAAFFVVIYYLYSLDQTGDSAESRLFKGATDVLLSIIRFFTD